MDPAGYERFSAAIVETLAADPAVVGVVATGSTAALGRRPDAWSDHDLWVVTTRGHGPVLRTDPSWLPDPGRIALWFPETAHGVKVLYDDGHLVEFAVFDEHELDVARVNDYRVLLDRGGLADRIEARRAATPAGPADADRDDGWLVGQFLTHLVVGAGRHARGEHASGHDFVTRHAVDRLLALAVRHLPRAEDVLDDLDPRRRVERVFPRFGAALDAALGLPVPAAAVALLDLAETELASRIDWPARGAAATRDLLVRAAGTSRGSAAPPSPPPPSPPVPRRGR